MALLGDSFAICSYGDNISDGILSMSHVDPTVLEKRHEISVSDMMANAKNGEFSKIFSNTSFSIEKLANLLKFDGKKSNKDETSTNDMFRKYLLGFEVSVSGDGISGLKNSSVYVPSWGACHFRSYTTKKEFFPYGKSLFISTVAPFRRLKLARTLMTITRVLSMPKSIFEVKVEDTNTGEDVWEAVQQARAQYHTSSSQNATKLDDIEVQSEVWMPEGLVKFDSVDFDLDPDKVHDIEMLRDDLVMGVKIPKGYLISSDRSWGTSGLALLQQSKPFARSIHYLQSAFLTELSRMLTIHLVMKGVIGDVNDANFQFKLGMNFPLSEVEEERIDAKSSTIDLAKDIIETLSSFVSGGDRDFKMPLDIIKSVLSKYTFLDEKEINTWLKSIEKDREDPLKENMAKYNNRLKVILENKEDVVSEALFEGLKSQNITSIHENNKNCVINLMSTNDVALKIMKEETKNRRYINKGDQQLMLLY